MVCARLCLTSPPAILVAGAQGMGVRIADSLPSLLKMLFRPEPPAPGFCLSRSVPKAYAPWWCAP
jgi:hypothetical protein